MAVVSRLRPAEISPQEWDIRCDLAALYRAFVRYGWTDLIYTHISARHPDEPGCYLINPFGLMFEEITASSLIVVDYDGNLVSGDWPVNEAGHAIHHAILKERSDANWVLHTHTRAGMAVSCMKCGLLPISQQAMFFHDRVSYHPWDIQDRRTGRVRQAGGRSCGQQCPHSREPRSARLRSDSGFCLLAALQSRGRLQGTGGRPGIRPGDHRARWKDRGTDRGFVRRSRIHGRRLGMASRATVYRQDGPRLRDLTVNRRSPRPRGLR